MDILKLVLLLLNEHPKGAAIVFSAFRLFDVCDTNGYSREAVCKAMVAALPADGKVSPSQVYALSELWDAMPEDFKQVIREQQEELPA